LLGRALKNPILFSEDAPHFETHSLRLNTDTELVVNLIGKRLPDITDPNLSEEDSEMYYAVVLTLFQPFGVDNAGCKTTWREMFHSWTPSLPAKRYMEHCQDYYTSRAIQSNLRDDEYEAYEAKLREENADEPDVHHGFFDDESSDSDTEFDHDYEIGIFMEDASANIANIDDFARIITHTVDTNLNTIGADDLKPRTERVDIYDLKKTLQCADLAKENDSMAGDEQDYSFATKQEIVTVISNSTADSRWRSPAVGVKPSNLPLDAYATISQISRHKCLNLEQHLIFAQYAKALMLGLAQGHGITDIGELGLGSRHKQVIGFLNGGAGFGKSAAVVALQFLACNWKVPNSVRTASYNGIAAANIGGFTLSSMFGWSIYKIGYSGKESNTKPETAACREDWSSVIILIVDEVSTLQQAHLGLLEDSLCRISNDQQLVAGGFNLLLIGTKYLKPLIL
jgi:hypothetical protein